MTDFSGAAIDLVLRHEGGFSNHKNDPGGATKYGISLRTLKKTFKADPEKNKVFDFDSNDEITEADIRNLTKDMALEYYYVFWWKRFNFEMIPTKKMALKTFNVAVNIGPTRAIKFLQQSINDIIPRFYLVEDGILGRNTEEALKKIALSPKRECNLYAIFILNMELWYRELVHNNKSLAPFLKGWINRLYDNEHLE